MKSCQCCGYQTPRDEYVCPCCGEQSWREQPVDAPVEVIEQPKSGKASKR